MKITRDNYESFFLDYLEGSLDPSLMKEMHAFLKRNPDLKAEMEEFEQVSLQADPILFREKEELKKNIWIKDDMGKRHFDHLYIAKLEGDLSIDEEEVLDQLLIEEPQRKKELELYLKTKLKPLPVIFPDKLLLKRKVPVIRQKSLWYSISAAASIILILVFTLLLGRFRNSPEEHTAFVPTAIESSVATVSEKAAAESEELAASLDQQDVEQEVPEEEFETVEGIDIMALNIAEQVEQEKESISGKDSEIFADLRTNMETLSRREYVPINTSHYLAIATPETIERHIELEGEYLTLRELVARRIKRAVSSEETGETRGEDRITFLDIAEAGVRGLNRISGTDMKLDRYYDQNGELTSYAFTSRTLSFSHEVKK